MSITEYGVPVPRPEGPPRDPTPPDPPPGDDRKPRRSRPVGWGIAFIAAGVLWMLSLAGVDIRWDLVVPVALIGIGLALAVGARWGTGGGLLGLGIVLTIVAIVTSLLPVPVTASAGDRELTITEITELQPSYSLGAGSLTLDLRDLELPRGTTEVAARVTLGELVVRVPDDVAVTGRASVTIGEVEGFDHTNEGIGPSIQLSGDGPDDAILELDLRAGIGRIEVTR
jgi:hypothetical protein